MWEIFAGRVPARPPARPGRHAARLRHRPPSTARSRSTRRGARRRRGPVAGRRRQRPDRRVRARARPRWASTVRVLDYAEHALSSGGDAQAAAYVEVRGRRPHGVGRRGRREHRHRLAAGGHQRRQPRPRLRSPGGVRHTPGAAYRLSGEVEAAASDTAASLAPPGRAVDQQTGQHRPGQQHRRRTRASRPGTRRSAPPSARTRCR